MENNIDAEKSGTVKEIKVAAGDIRRRRRHRRHHRLTDSATSTIWASGAVRLIGADPVAR